MAAADEKGDVTWELSPKERAVQFLIAHEQCLEEGVTPPDLPADLLGQLAPGERDRLLKLVEEQRRRLGGSRAEPHGQDGAAVVVVPEFEILKGARRGGMGVVYEALDLSLKRRVALKMILAGSHSDRKRLQRFRAEAETIARLRHPNIVEIFRVGEHGGMPYLVLEYCEGGSLDRALSGVPMKPAEGARVVQALAGAVDHAHREGIIHRDLKPANVLLGKGGVLKVSDFGLAKSTDQPGQTASGAIIGTPEYMSPEQAAGRRAEVGPKSDVYALGVILYELLTGRPPFREASPLDTLQKVIKETPVPPRQLTREIPRDLETICLKAMDKDARRRYASARDLADDLERWLGGLPIVAQPPSLSYLSAKFARRHRTPLAVAAVVLTLFLGGLAVAFFRIDLERRLTLQVNERLERQLYATRIAVAERELTQNNDIALAEKLLNDCREDLRGWEWRYLRRLLDGVRPPLVGHDRGLWMVDFSPDGRHVATAGIDGTAKVWDVSTGRLARSIDVDAGAVPFGLGPIISRLGIGRIPVMCVEYSPDGRHLAAGSFAPRAPLSQSIGVVGIWDVATCERVLKFEGQLGVVLSLAYSPDGRRIASSSINPDNTFVVWEAATGKVVKVVRGHRSQIHRLRYTPDGGRIAAADTDGTVRIWDAATFEQARRVRRPPLPRDGPRLLARRAAVRHGRGRRRRARLGFHGPAGSCSN